LLFFEEAQEWQGPILSKSAIDYIPTKKSEHKEKEFGAIFFFNDRGDKERTDA